MSDVLVRGLPDKVRARIQRLAHAQNLSVNQLLIRLLVRAVEGVDEERKEKERHREAFRRLEELREEFRSRYGKQEDSVNLIRQMRRERLRRLTRE